MKTYRSYYAEAQQKYTGTNDFSYDLYNHTIKWFQPGEQPKITLVGNKEDGFTAVDIEPFVEFPYVWDDLIARTSQKINSMFEDDNNHYGDPADIKALGSYSSDLAVKLKTPFDMSELEEIAQAMLPQLEKNLFHSFIHLSHLHIYRNKISDAGETSSWLAHVDNTPKECIKMLVYLTDADESSGAMSFLRHKETGEAIKVPSSRTDHAHWGPHQFPNKRVPPEVLEGLYKRGYEWVYCNGKAGTVLVFDNDIIHKANINKSAIRDVANYLIRPSDHRLDKYVDPKYCGGFDKDSPLMDPEDQITRLK